MSDVYGKNYFQIKIVSRNVTPEQIFIINSHGYKWLMQVGILENNRKIEITLD